MKVMSQANVLALDLEGTLISSAVSQFPRPGLFDFLSRCHELFERVVIFTAVKEEKFRPIAEALVCDGFAPEWFKSIEYIDWSGDTKDLKYVPDASESEILLVDDMKCYVRPGQESQWLNVASYDPTDPSDDALEVLQRMLEGIVEDACFV